MARPRSPAKRPSPADGKFKAGDGVPLLIARLLVAGSLLAGAFAVSATAESSFDGPKRFLCLTLIAIAAVFVAGTSTAIRWPWQSRGLARIFWIFATVAILAVVASTLVSPRPVVALDALRCVCLYGLAVFLGASRLVDDVWRRRLGLTFSVGAGVNGLISVLQAFGAYQPFQLERTSGRGPAGALLGNEGSVALMLAMSATIAIAVLFRTSSRPSRVALSAFILVALAGILATINLTAILAVGAGTVVAAITGLKRSTLLRTGVVIVILGAVATLALPGLRERVRTVYVSAQTGNYDELLTYRLGPWAAAVEMTIERPLTGFGLGTFAGEYATHRLDAERRWQARLADPQLVGSYGEAHSEYLQAAAEAGMVAWLALAGCAVVLTIGLVRRIREGSSEAGVLLAFFAALATSSLTWFPFQRASTAIFALLCIGRAISLLQAAEEP